MALIDKLTNIADAIREQTGETGLLTLDAMATSIGNISGTNFSIVGGTTKPKTGDTLYWDGDTEGREVYSDTFYKVSDVVPSLEDFSQGAYTMLSTNVPNEKEIDPNENIVVFNYGICIFDFIYIINSDNAGVSKGIYFLSVDGYRPLYLTITGFTGFEKEDVKENTIWVNTDTEITNWHFSATEPESPVEGMVWFSTGTSSHAEFNVLKKNGITVYPLTAKQYVDAAWVSVTANSFQNGEWVYWWQGELFKDGNEYTGVTGGWQARDMKVTGATANGAAPVITKNGDSVTVSQETYAAGGVYEIANDIDLSKYSTLTFEVSANSYGLKGLAVYDRSITTLGTSTNAPLANAIASATLSNGHTGPVSINVSGINKKVCIGIAVYCLVTGQWPTVTMTESVLS